MEIENNCKNCKFYVKHYEIYNNVRLRYIQDGHCKNGQVRKNISRALIAKNSVCKHWEKEQPDLPTENAQKLLRNIKRQINELLLIFKND